MNKATEYYKSNIENIVRYQKDARVLCRPAIPGEFVITIVDGQVETVNTATADDIIVKNINVGTAGEQYIINGVKFLNRYAVTGGIFHDGVLWTFAVATGQVDAVEYVGESFTFESPWGEEMLVNSGDFLCLIPGEDIECKVYRIEKEAFSKTYKKLTE